jgi:folylpolyglutamate synthase/dihydropteroate synthase
MIFLVVKNVKPSRAVNPGRKEVFMEQIYSLLKLFGERYINCSDDQAMLDAAHNRESLVSAFNAILYFTEMKGADDE